MMGRDRNIEALAYLQVRGCKLICLHNRFNGRAETIGDTPEVVTWLYRIIHEKPSFVTI